VSHPLRVLVVEDSESDAAIIVRFLEKADYEVQWQRIDTAGDMREALARQPWDVVISDYHLPQFDAPAALATLKEAGLDIPFIVVSGTIGEETAVALIKAGAQDCLGKENLARLAPAVGREIADARDRAMHHQTETALRESETRFRTLVEMAPQAIFIGINGRLAFANGAAQRIAGATSAGELLGRSILDLFHPDRRVEAREDMRLLNEEHLPVSSETVAVRLDGSAVQVEISAIPFHYEGEDGALAFVRDITERKRAEAALVEQLEELRRWHEMTLGRETRILELKREVNQLLVEAGSPPRYVSADVSSAEEPKP
jgi:PAS domain S-box-containing protein